MPATDDRVPARVPLNRDRVLDAAIRLADEGGVEVLSMRKLAHHLGVVPMALYKHVANKDQLLDGMVDAVIAEIDAPARGAGWKAAFRQRILSARAALLRHPWAAPVIESRTDATPAVLAYMDDMIGILRRGGLSVDLTHHAIHAMGSRMLGFSQELFDDSAILDPSLHEVVLASLAPYAHITEVVTTIIHDEQTVVGSGCDDQAEFEFALDLILDGLERRHRRERRARPD